MNFKNFLLPAEAEILAALCYGYQSMSKPYCKEGFMERAWTPVEIMILSARRLMNANIGDRKFYFEHVLYDDEHADWAARSYKEITKDKRVPYANFPESEKKKANEVIEAILSWDEEILKRCSERPEIVSLFEKMGLVKAGHRVPMENKVVQEGISVSALLGGDPVAVHEFERPKQTIEEMFENPPSIGELEIAVNNAVMEINDKILKSGPKAKSALSKKKEEMLKRLADYKKAAGGD